MDGKTEIGWFLFIPPRSIGEARGGVLYYPARRHHHGLPERVLRAPSAPRLLRGAPVAYGARPHNENDIAGEFKNTT